MMVMRTRIGIKNRLGNHSMIVIISIAIIIDGNIFLLLLLLSIYLVGATVYTLDLDAQGRIWIIRQRNQVD